MKTNLFSSKRRDVLKRLLKQNDLETHPTGIPKRTGDPALAPLSFAQQRLWFLDQMEPGNTTYNIPHAFRVKGPLNIQVMEQSIREIIRRHEILRTSFCLLDVEPMQIIAPDLDFSLPVVDLESLPEEQRQSDILKIIDAESHIRFDLTSGPMLQCKLLRLHAEEHLLLLTMHHIISDGWSIMIMLGEANALYTAFLHGEPSPLPELPIQYADFAVWQRERLAGGVQETLMDYWRGQLADAPTLELPTDRLRPAIQTFSGAQQTFNLPTTLTTQLQAIGRQEGATLFMTLLATFNALLYRYTGQDDIVVGSPITSRNRVDTNSLIGCFVNTLTLRTDLSGNPNIRTILRNVVQTCLSAYRHQDIQFEHLVEELQPARDMSRPPFFQVLFSLENKPVQEITSPDLSMSIISRENGRAKYDLTLALTETASGLSGAFEYNTDLFDAETIRRMIHHFEMLLQGIVAHPDQPVSRLPLLTAPETEQILQAWNRTETEYPQGQCMHELFEIQVEKNPDAIAVVFNGQQLTYNQLNTRANQLAHYLRSMGVGPDVLVGICVDRSLEMMVGLMGVLKAGGAYVPLDPAYPVDRLTYMLEDARPAILLTQAHLQQNLPIQGFCLDSQWETLGGYPVDNPAHLSSPDNLAYVIYTSGSTGRPKGVQVLQKGLVNFLSAMLQQPGLTVHDKLLAVTTLSFDIAGLELYLPLIVGAQLEVASREVAMDGFQLRERLKTGGVTMLQATPATWRLLLEAGWDEPIKALCGGEALPPSLADAMLPHATSLWNMYGPTETTIWSTLARVESAAAKMGNSPIGRPIANTQIYILDAHLQPMPVGVPGELYIAGDGLARGYRNRPDLTAEKFIPNPFIQDGGPWTVDGGQTHGLRSTVSGRMYRTGDLARYLPDGNIEYLGRMDSQVKVRGFRIELGEIETALAAFPGVRNAVALARDDAPGGRGLVAYLVMQPGEDLPDAAVLHSKLAQSLPEYMIPSYFMALEHLPLTPNGKINRKALPAPEFQRSEADYVPPSTPIQNALAQIWGEVLKIDRVGIHDNFFMLGGHSLLAAQVISRLRQTFNVEVSLRELFQSPTVAGLAEAVQAAKKVQGVGVALLPRPKEIPLSFEQYRMWLSDQLDPGTPINGMFNPMRIRGPLDVDALERAYQEIVRRHESLHMYFQATDGVPHLVIDPGLTVTLVHTDLSASSPEEQTREVRRLSDETILYAFDLSTGPLVMCRLVRLAENDYILLLMMHHIIMDGWSIGIFIREMVALYRAFSAGQASPLPEMRLQYSDYVLWERALLQGEAFETLMGYWRKALENLPAGLDLPTDHPRPAKQAGGGMRIPFDLSPELSAGVLRLTRQEGATLYMVLLAALQTLLARYSGQPDIVIGSPVANRSQVEFENVIGFFVNNLLLRTDLSGDPSFRELLQRVRMAYFGAFEHQEIPYQLLIEELQTTPDESRNPLFQVMFVLQESRLSGLPPLSEELTLEGLKTETDTAQFDLYLSLQETDGEMGGFFVYDTGLFEHETMLMLPDLYCQILAGWVANPEQRISEIQLPEALIARMEAARMRDRKE